MIRKYWINILIVIFITYFLFITIFLATKINKIENYLVPNTTNNKLNIIEKTYYKDNLLTDDTYNDYINDDEYILYFHQENCNYCLETNVLIDSLVENNKIKIYFLTPDLAHNVFTSNNIESTPTIKYVKDGYEETYVGSKEIEEFINKHFK